MNTDLGTRDRLVAAMRDALQRRGLHGVGLNELLAQAAAPKGVLYHHFPGGKTALAVAAIEATVEALGQALEGLLQRHGGDPLAALASWVDAAVRLLDGSAYERGCPLATVALESTPDDVALRQALAAGFARLRLHISTALRGVGHPADAADGLAALIVAAYEGGLLQSRVAQDPAPMRAAADALLALLRQAAPRPAARRRPTPPAAPTSTKADP